MAVLSQEAGAKSPIGARPQSAANPTPRSHEQLGGLDTLPGVLDTFPAAVLLVDAQSRVLQANRRAERLLSAADGLRCVGQKLVAVRAAETQALHGLVAESARAGVDLPLFGGGALAIVRASGRGPLTLLARLVCGSYSRGSAPPYAVVLLTVTDPQAGEVAGARSLAAARGLFCLTATEARVALQVASGHSLPEAAMQLGIGAGTAHAHLKQVYSKTGAHRQASLARLFSRCGVLDLDAAH